MTPMQKLKPQFDEFKGLLGNGFQEVVLNKSDYKEEYVGFCGEKTQYINKGVRSDFIRLYKLEYNKEDTTNIAFSFNYLDIEEDKQRITFSLSMGKENKTFSKKLEMTTEECRTHLNNINKALKVMENSSNEEILKIIKENFLGSDYTLTKETKKKKIR